MRNSTKKYTVFINCLAACFMLSSCGGGGGGGSSSTGASAKSLSSASSTSSSSSTVSGTPPIANLTFPSIHSQTENAKIIVRGTASDDSGKIKSVRLNDINAITQDGFATWEAEIPLKWGLNEIIISTQDQEGNINPKALSFSVKRAQLLKSIQTITPDIAHNRALVLDKNLQAVFAVNLDTGERSPFSTNTHPNSDTPLEQPVCMTIDTANNRLLVIDMGFNSRSIVSIDLTTGSRTNLVKFGNLLLAPENVVFDKNKNRLLIGDSQAIIAYDFSSQEFKNIPAYTIKNIPQSLYYFSNLAGLVMDDSHNRAFAIDTHRLLEIDLETNFLKIVSDINTPDSVDWGTPKELALDTINNRVLVASTAHSKNKGAILSIDINTGQRSYLSNKTIPNESLPLTLNYHLAIIPGKNQLLVSDAYNQSIVSINTDNGARSAFSDNSLPDRSSDTQFNAPLSLASDKTIKTFYVMDEDENTLFAIDRTTSQRQIVFTELLNHGTNNYSGIIVDENKNRALIADTIEGGIISIDLSSGKKSVFSKGDTPDSTTPLQWPTGIMHSAITNDIYILDLINGFIKANPETGSTLLVTSRTTPAGNIEFTPGDFFALDEQKNRAIFADTYNARLIAVDLASGIPSVHSDNTTPDSNVPFVTPVGIIFDKTRNQLIVSGQPGLIGVDINTGKRKLLIDSAQLPGLYLRSMVLDEECYCLFYIDSQERALRMLDIAKKQAVTISR